MENQPRQNERQLRGFSIAVIDKEMGISKLSALLRRHDHRVPHGGHQRDAQRNRERNLQNFVGYAFALS